MIYISVVDLRTLFFCYAQGPGPFADYRLGTVTPSLATYIFLAAKAMSLQSAMSMEGRPKRANRPKGAERHCSSNIAVPLVSAGVFVVSGSEVGQ